jgi:hypothetical protein
MNQLEQAIVEAAVFGGAPPRTFEVGPEADVEFSATVQGHPFDGMTVTHWTRD